MAASMKLIVTLFLLIQLPIVENFNVIAQKKRVIATIGKDALLTCSLNPASSAEHMEVRWYRSVLRPYVHLYDNGTSNYQEQMQEFHGRTELLTENIIKGNVTLVIYDVRPSDEGKYNCFFVSSSSYNGAEQELKVTATGLEHFTHIENFHQDGIAVSCWSKGWYPEPEVTWRSSDGAIVPQFKSEATVVNGLFDIQASINVNSGFRFTCVITNTISNEVVQLSIAISDNIFGTIKKKSISPFIVLASSLCAIIIILWALFTSWRKTFHSMEEKNKTEKKKLTEDIQRKHETIVKMNKEIDGLKSDNVFLGNMLQSMKVDITLDTGCNGLIVSDDGKCVEQTSRGNRELGFLGLQEFSSGRHYWLVKILRSWHGCVVGVADKSKLNPDLHIPSPKNGIYALWLWKGDFKNCQSQNNHLTIRVWLDIENRNISVFCDETKMLIHKRYFGKCLQGHLCPFFLLSPGAEIVFL
ncbi:butyrophilin subfamily 3 member A2 isoform X1 [Xenopus laevis]|uniref:Butyrophilin subfamily 3 member A2 isoform X1 n=1 Tax=Xenopus laevis TaxID=8355 RepID=A0A8J1LKY6_XENLA|nr:butyrophilin subfamily 3 member A2 isoform X1 [Xenopus laevis]